MCRNNSAGASKFSIAPNSCLISVMIQMFLGDTGRTLLLIWDGPGYLPNNVGVGVFSHHSPLLTFPTSQVSALTTTLLNRLCEGPPFFLLKAGHGTEMRATHGTRRSSK